MDTDVSHEVERRLSRLEDKVGISDEEETGGTDEETEGENGDNGDDDE